MSQLTITVVGLGSMGLGMANVLLSAGYDVIGFDINPAQTTSFCNSGGRTLCLADAGKQSDIVISVVLNADQTESSLFGPDGAALTMRKGGLLISCATIAPNVAEAMSERADKLGLHYLDAPISGGARRAASGELSIMAAGPEDAFQLARPALDAMATTVHDMGRKPGAASAMKSVNQLLAGVHIAAMGEALAYAQAQGLDLAKVVDVICQSAGNSWMFEDRAPRVVDADWTPRSAVRIWPKDLGIVLDAAQASNADVTMTKAALSLFEQAVAAGDAALDDSVVTRVSARAGGREIPGDT